MPASFHFGIDYGQVEHRCAPRAIDGVDQSRRFLRRIAELAKGA
jgi:hypothetical protein